MEPIICLASQSKSRRDVLERAYVRFEMKPSSVEERYEGEKAVDYVTKLAKMKGEEVIHKTQADLLVSADSVVYFGDEIIEKPKNELDAIEILKKLQGNTHVFLTGLYVANPETHDSLLRSIKTKVTFSRMSENLIKDYVERFQPLTFAGGYDNSISSWFIERIEGSISNLMGLPMTDLRKMIEGLGFEWFQFIKS